MDAAPAKIFAMPLIRRQASRRHALRENAANMFEKLRDAMKTGIPQPLTTKDLLRSAKAINPSTKEWFSTARNYATHANQDGTYDDILSYLNRS